MASFLSGSRFLLLRADRFIHHFENSGHMVGIAVMLIVVFQFLTSQRLHTMPFTSQFLSLLINMDDYRPCSIPDLLTLVRETDGNQAMEHVFADLIMLSTLLPAKGDVAGHLEEEPPHPPGSVTAGKRSCSNTLPEIPKKRPEPLIPKQNGLRTDLTLKMKPAEGCSRVEVPRCEGNHCPPNGFWCIMSSIHPVGGGSCGKERSASSS